MAIRTRVLLLSLAAAGACASPAPDTARPTPASVSRVGVTVSHGGLGSTEIRNDAGAVARTVAAPLDSIWAALPGVYETLGIAGAGADPEQKLYGNPAFKPRRIDGERLSRYIDCGRGVTAAPRADEFDVTMSVITRLAPAAGGGTLVTTTVQASGKPRAVSGNPVFCPSKGTLEALVVDLLLEVL